jgi:hypothetical protein
MMNPNTLNLILQLAQAGTGIAAQIIPLFVHRDANGNVTAVSIGVILEATDARNAVTLAAIAAANAQTATAKP